MSKLNSTIGWLLVLLLSLQVAFLGSCASVTGNPASRVTVPEIIEMTKAGATDDQIINEIEQSKTVYKLDGNQYARLRQQGVSDKVIDYMQETYTNQIQGRQDRDEDWEMWNLEDAGY